MLPRTRAPNAGRFAAAFSTWPQGGFGEWIEDEPIEDQQIEEQNKPEGRKVIYAIGSMEWLAEQNKSG